jgi:hypothetical protein
VATDLIFIFIVLNLYNINPFLSLPTLFCLKIGEPVSKSPIIYKIKKMGHNNNNPKNENNKS